MDRHGIAISVLSTVQSGPWLGNDDEGRRLARTINDFGAQMVRDHRGRFGLFATLPLRDTAGSLSEIEYAFGTLKADGIGLMTSYMDRWLGVAAFAARFPDIKWIFSHGGGTMPFLYGRFTMFQR
ncbi:MAG: hypothetical protein ABIU95_07295 [Burkholderiales bacterium]